MLRIAHLLRNPQLSFRISPSFRSSKRTTVRHVKFQRPWIRRSLTTLVVYGTAFHLWSSFVLVQFDDGSDEGDTAQAPDLTEKQPRATSYENSVDSSDRIEDSVDDYPIHIPLSWPRKKEGKFYAASDPEWQEFVKISKDREKIKSLKDELLSVVLNEASQSRLLSHVLGKNLSVSGFWLLHHFPSRAPPEYDRLGLEIRETGVYLVSRQMSSEDGDKMRRFMQPYFVVLAAKDATMVFLRRKLLRFRDPNSDREQATGTPDLLSSRYSFSPDSRSLDGFNNVSRSESQVPLSNSYHEDLPRDSENSHPSSIISSVQRLPLPKFGPGSDFYLSVLAFRWRLNEYWAQASHTPRRGIFYITGPVGLKGPKGFCRVEVKGEYDPASSTWTAVNIQLKDLNVFKQRPLGGR